MSAVGIVPARFASSRFPGKPLAEIAGLPMLRRVVEGVRTAKRLREVIVALSCWPSVAGSPPSAPEDTSAFCAEIAAATSDGISL